MHKPASIIQVYIWGKFVGALALDPKHGYYVFEYDRQFMKSGIELAPLTMPVSGPMSQFVFPELPELSFKRLPGMIADTLPDDFGNLLIDAWMTTHGVKKSDITALDRLAYMGKRSMGALEFKPSIDRSYASTALKLSRLIDTARMTVKGQIGSDRDVSAALQQIIRVGTSAGGARAKAAIALNPETKEMRSGQFDVQPGFEHWLLKFDGMGPDHELGGSQNYGRIEYAYYLMAREAGITMTECQLLEENGRAHFMTRRFDRTGNVKHHLQTLCGMAHLDYKQKATHDYNQLFVVIQDLGLGDSAMEEVFRRVAFNIIAANCDDHTKNFSFILRQGGNWELAPAYDVTHAFNPRGEWTYQHLMSVNGKFNDVTLRDFLVVAERFRIADPKKILREVQRAVKDWQLYAKESGLPERDIERVGRDHQIILPG